MEAGLETVVAVEADDDGAIAGAGQQRGHREAERLDQVQAAAGIGAQPDCVAGVGRNLGPVQDDVEHCSSLV